MVISTEQIQKAMVYNGPFKLEGWTGSNLKWTLAKNDKYWDKKKVVRCGSTTQLIKQDQTAYNLYQSGKIDATALGAEQAKQPQG